MEPAVTPFPGAGDRIADRDEQRCKDQESRQFDSTGDGSGDDRAARSGKHSLEEEVRERRVRRVVGGACKTWVTQLLRPVQQKTKAGKAKEFVACSIGETRIHQVESRQMTSDGVSLPLQEQQGF